MSHPVRCAFKHPRLAGGAEFCRVGGLGAPALSLSMGDRPMLLPLEQVARLFGIVEGSADSLMLELVGDSLRFVPTLRVGDALPAEVLTGEASWRPDPRHDEAARARMRRLLLAWAGPGGVPDAAALRRIAQTLGLDGGGAAVAALIERVTGEMAYIEALHERLFLRLSRLQRRIGQHLRSLPVPAAARRAALVAVSRLAGDEAAAIASRLEDAEACPGGLLGLLMLFRQDESALRPLRDALYSDLVAWRPAFALFEPWPEDEPAFWQAIRGLHRFLAARAVR